MKFKWQDKEYINGLPTGKFTVYHGVLINIDMLALVAALLCEETGRIVYIPTDDLVDVYHAFPS